MTNSNTPGNEKAERKSAVQSIIAKLEQSALPQALAETEALLARDPGFATAWYLKGLICQRQQLPDALQHFNRALNLKPDFREACLTLAHALENMQRNQPAIKVFEHWLTIEQHTEPTRARNR